MKNIIILLFAFMPFCLAAQVTVKGVVKDSGGELLAGATVIEEGNPANGVITGIDGDFVLTLKSDKSMITVRFIGYQSKTLRPSSGTMIIELHDDGNMLKEVEVVRMGFGSKPRISNVASISQINAQQIRQTPTASVQNALAGRLPGLFQIQGAGQPGNDAAELFIRGISTYSGASTAPLILIDDIESDMKTLSQLSTNEIEEISVLKDAGSTAIFGIKGANGVILVTTRRGNEGPAKVTFRSDVGLQQPTYKNKFLGSYESLSLIRELLRNDGNTTALEDPMYSDEALEHYKAGDMPYRYPNVDWYDLLYKKASLQQQYTVDVQGGTDKVNYFVSLSYLDQGGLFKEMEKEEDFDNNYYQRRYNIRSNFDIKITKDFLLKLNANGILSEVNEPNLPSPRESGTFSIFRRILGGRFTPWRYPAYNPDGSFGGYTGTSVNPLALLTYNGYKRDFRNNVNGNITLEHNLDFIAKGLKARGVMALTNTWAWKRELTRGEALDFSYDEETDSYRPIINNQYVLPPLAVAETKTKPFIKINTRFDLVYDRKFGSHGVSGLLLGNWYSDRSGEETPGNTISYSGRLSYNYNSRYITELSCAYNGSDRFADGNRFDFFPAVSLGWNLAEEPYLKDTFRKFKIGTLKLRGSYGISGSDALSADRYTYQESYVNDFDYFFGEDPKKTLALVLKSLGNNNVKWETEKKLNLGVDMRLFEDRLAATVDYFHNKRSDILTTRNSIVIYAGFRTNTLPYMNIGRTRNRGWDGELSWRDKIGKDFSYFFRGTLSYAKNKILDMDEAPSEYVLSMQTGRAIGTIFGFVADGFYNTQEDINNGPYDVLRGGASLGDIKYRDISGPNGAPDGIIDEYDRVPIGNSRPDFNYGLSFGFSYKNFDFSALFQGATGASLSIESMLRIGGTDGRPMPIHEGRWTYYDKGGNYISDPAQLAEMNKNASFPLLKAGNGKNQAASSYWLRSADYLRWKNLEVGYNFPSKWFGKAGVKSLRIYGSAQNLITWSGLGDYQVDPESSRTTSFNSTSVGPLDTYPQQRVYNLGCQIVF
ncbi:MAG: TonB-dependent receptor [Prevotella sp.]|nr:TonB-dependent receptor [Prevotella sp.]